MNIIVDSKFKPFTYDELMKPLEDYTKAYREAEAKYENLAQQTEAFRYVANQEDSPEAYELFNGYAEDLNNVLQDFSRGMTLANRRELLNLNRRYASEITPIATAHAARQEYLKRMWDIRAKTPSARFKNASPSLDDFLFGRTVDDSFINGDAILARASAKAEKLGKALFSDPTFKTVMGGQKWDIAQQNGISPEMLDDVINNTLNDPKYDKPEYAKLKQNLMAFRRIVDDELSAVSDWDDSIKDFVAQQAITGLYAGLAAPTHQYGDNGEYVSKAERDASAARWAGIALDSRKVKIAEEQFAYEKDKDQISMGSKPYYTSPDGNTRYYSNGKLQWTETKNAEGEWVSTTAVPIKSSTGASNNKKMPTLYWQADDAEASNVNSVSQKRAKVRAEAEKILDPKELNIKQQEHIKSVLAASGTGWTIDDVEVGVIEHTFKDDEFFLIPKEDTSNSQSTTTNTNTNTTNDYDSQPAGMEDMEDE